MFKEQHLFILFRSAKHFVEIVFKYALFKYLMKIIISANEWNYWSEYPINFFQHKKIYYSYNPLLFSNTKYTYFSIVFRLQTIF